jgi:nucleoside-triphosphatase THEP1
MNALDCSKPVLGTIALRSDPWLDTVKSYARVYLYELTPNNRNSIISSLIDVLKRLPCPA